MFTATVVVMATFLYLNIGYWLGKKIFEMAQDDTPTEQLSFKKKVARWLLFPMFMFVNWRNRTREWNGAPFVLANWVKCNEKTGNCCIDTEGARVFTGLYTFLWPLFRILPTIIACIIGPVKIIEELHAGSKTLEIRSFLKTIIGKLRFRSKNSEVNLADILKKNGEVKARREQILSLLQRGQDQFNKLISNAEGWEKIVKSARDIGRDAKKFENVLAMLKIKIADKLKRGKDLVCVLQTMDGKIAELEEMLKTIQRYEETLRILNEMNDDTESVRNELGEVLGAAQAIAEFCQKIYDLEQEQMARLDAPIEVLAGQIIEGEDRVRDIQKEVVKMAVR